MKNILLLLTCCADVLNISCKKNDADGSPSNLKHKVTFKVDDFSQVSLPMGKANPANVAEIGDTLENHASFLYYMVFNAQGYKVIEGTQTADSASFGTISTALPSGSYTVNFIASKEALTFSVLDQQGHKYFYARDNDIFFKSVNILVENTGINQTVRLSRMVSAFELNIQDEQIPDDVESIIVEWSDATYLSTREGAVYGSPSQRDRAINIVDGQNGRKAEALFVYIIDTNNPFDLKIKYQYTNQQPVSKIVSGIRCYVNKKTVISGTLFPEPTNGSQQFNVTVNPVWEDPVFVTF